MKFKAMVLASLAGVGIISLGSTGASAAKVPRELLSDERVKQTVYDPNQVYEIVGTYGYQTAIEFAQDETVKVVSLGDSIAWQTVPYQNRLFIKPVEPNATTNLTVITDKRTYYFKLDSARNRKSPTFLVRFIYPGNQMPELEDKAQGSRLSWAQDAVSPMSSPRRNADYGISGDRQAIALHQVFDDGQFTYLRFDASTEIPSVYTVGADGTESIVNTRREGDYLVVERTASLFTLRNGRAYLCVRNNAKPYAGAIAGAAPASGGH
jgi:type IV secretion system protein VirB9